MAKEFKLPELGENVEAGDIVDILVGEGDSVNEDQTLLEIETDKAVIEVPAPFEGKIEKVHVSKGDSVDVGQLIFTYEPGAAGEAAEETEAEPEAEKAEQAEKEEEAETTPAAEEKTAEEETAEEETEKQPEPEEKVSEAKKTGKKPGMPGPDQDKRQIIESAKGRKLVPAAPSVRRFAREIGIDIHEVPGSGDNGRISIDDVKQYSKQLNQQGGRAAAAGGTALPTPELPDFSKWGEIEREPMSNVRKKTAEHMTNSWTPVPHVTNHDKADITDLEELRKKWGKKAEKAGGKLTYTAILLKIAAAALKKFPQFNTSIDMQKQEVIYKKYINIGIAVDTDRGLLVPVIRDVDQKNIIDLSVELSEIAEKARNKKISPDDLNGGNFSISNLGGIGGHAFTPIVNQPEVAILGVSRGSMEPVYIDGEFQPRLKLPLSLSYDHRMIDGADAARFLRWVCEALEEPLLMAMEG
ncbi:MAG: branched-chain alpha-keto acid dehydrogenase subunit E2 [Candidatus Marinimicrobia bacterium]|nr:branched-chain alpha-keto acid dehydrogenase subunit E2 [Candidatus Neomarinimicrobiota bacterium]